jgi:hypothetical protein
MDFCQRNATSKPYIGAINNVVEGELVSTECNLKA